MSQNSASSGHPPRPPAVSVLRSLPASRQTSRASSPRSLQSYKPAARLFRPDAHAKEGLSTGDAVVLQCANGDMFYRISSASSSEQASGGCSFAPSERGGPGDSAAQLEVVTVGDGWFGLRSGTAGDRFLQARKHGANRLGFRSANLGVWEQWRIKERGDNLEAPWDVSGAVCLQNRRLPHFELDVILVRVGQFTSLGGAITPRSITTISEENNPEKGALRRMSDAVTHEWVTHAERERAQRAEAESRLAELAAAQTQLRAWAAAKVEMVRGQVDTDISALLTAIQEKSKELASSRADAEGARTAALSALRARQETSAQREAFRAWRNETALAAQRRAWAAAAERRRDAKLLETALEAWREYREQRAATRARLRLAVRRLSMQRLGAAFSAWREEVRASVERRQAADAMAESHELAAQRNLLKAWRNHCQAIAAGRKKLEQISESRERQTVRAALYAWRDSVAENRETCQHVVLQRQQHLGRAIFCEWRKWYQERLNARKAADDAKRMLQKSTLRRALRAWRQERELMRAREEAAEALHRQVIVKKVLLGWQQSVKRAEQMRAALVLLVEKKAQRIQREAFAGWKELVEGHRRACAVISRQLQSTAREYQIVTLRMWHQYTKEEIMYRWVEQHAIEELARSRVQTVFAIWQRFARYKAERRKVLEACEMARRERQLRSALVTWRERAADLQFERSQAERAGAAHRRTLLARALGALAGAADLKRRLKDSLHSVAKQRKVLFLRDIFNAWRAQTQEAQAYKKQEHRAEAWHQRRLTRAVLQGWLDQCQLKRQAREAAEEKGNVKTMQQAHGVFTAWRSQTATERSIQRQFVVAVMRNSTRRLATTLRAWKEKVDHSREKRALLGRARHVVSKSTTRRSFTAWREVVDEARAVRAGEADLRARAQRRVLRGAFGAWRAAASGAADARAAVVTWGIEVSAPRRDSGLVRDAFDAWRAVVAQLAEARAVVSLKADAEAEAAARTALRSWRLEAIREREKRKLALERCIDRRAFAISAATFGVWRSATALAARNRRVMTHAVEKRAANLQRVALVAWLSAVREKKARVTALRRFLARRRLERLTGAFGSWQAAVDDARESRERLERCLMTKQVAFRNFRAWYWDAFDEDMQDTLRTIFEVTGQQEDDHHFVLRDANAASFHGTAAQPPLGPEVSSADFTSPPKWSRGEMPVAQQKRLADSVTRSLVKAGIYGDRSIDCISEEQEGLLSPPATASTIQARIEAASAAGIASAARAIAAAKRGVGMAVSGEVSLLSSQATGHDNDDGQIHQQHPVAQLRQVARHASETSEVFLPMASSNEHLASVMLTQQTPGPLSPRLRDVWREKTATNAGLLCTPTPLATSNRHGNNERRSHNAAAASAGKAFLSSQANNTPATYLRGIMTTPRDAAARRALELARTPLSAGTTLRPLCSPGPSAALARQLAPTMSFADGTPGRSYLEAETPPMSTDKENQDIRWYQGMTPSHRYTAEYLSKTVGVDEWELGEAQTPPLSINPLSYLA